MKQLLPTMARWGIGSFAVTAAAFAGIQLSAQAIASHNSNAPVSYAADRIELQDRQNRVVLSGNVQITQAGLNLSAARTIVNYTDAGDLKIQRIMATGGVMTPGVNPEDAHYSAEEMAAGIHEGHRFHRTCASHAQGAEGILNAVRGGVDSIEHGIFMDAECIDEMLAHGTYLVPTLAAVKNIVAFKDQGVPDYVVEKAMRVEERHRQSVVDFYRAGGRIAMGTDAGTPFNFHGANARELEYMVEIGISAADALTISTGNGADLMQNAAIGEIAAGKAADLLIVEGDPLADILMVADPVNHRQVVKNGVTVPPA